MSERLQEPSLQAVLSKNIQGVASRAYQSTSALNDIPLEEVYHSGVCEAVSEVMARELSSMYGGNVQLLRFEKRGVAMHQFIRVTLGNEAWIIDPTWQQFLQVPDSGKPHVLCIRESDISQTLSENGISQTTQDIWKQAEEMPMPDNNL